MDWPVNEKWVVKASYIYVENQGDATFSSVNNYGNPLNIGNFDNTKQQYFNLKANYGLNKNWSFSGGYAYEKYSRDDIGARQLHQHPGVAHRDARVHEHELSQRLQPQPQRQPEHLLRDRDVQVRCAAASGRAVAGRGAAEGRAAAAAASAAAAAAAAAGAEDHARLRRCCSTSTRRC